MAFYVPVFDADFNGVICFTINVHFRLVVSPIISASAKTSYIVKQDLYSEYIRHDKRDGVVGFFISFLVTEIKVAPPRVNFDLKCLDKRHSPASPAKTKIGTETTLPPFDRP